MSYLLGFLVFVFCMILLFFLGFSGFADPVLFKKVYYKFPLYLPYFTGWEKHCEKEIDFPIYGIYVFTGKQGSGKTLSMVRFAYEISQTYNNVLMRSNFGLPFCQHITDFEEIFPLKRACICMDEVGLIANSKKSKDINTDILRITAQNRKNRRIILTTCQEYYQINKDIRTQATKIIEVNCIFKRLFINRYYEPVVDQDGNIKKTLPVKIDWFIATEKLFQLYDTLEVIN